MVALTAVRQEKAGPADGAGRKEAGVAGSAVPPTRLAERTRAAVRAVLLAELTAANTRAQAAGWSRETLFEVLADRLDAVAGETKRRSVAEDVCGQPNPAASSAADPDNPASSRLAAAGGRPAPSATILGRPPGRPAHRSSAAEDREHRRDDPLEPGLVGEGGG